MRFRIVIHGLDLDDFPPIFTDREAAIHYAIGLLARVESYDADILIEIVNSGGQVERSIHLAQWRFACAVDADAAYRTWL